MTELRVVRTARTWAVVDKPPGLLSVPGKGPEKQDCVPARVRVMFPHASGPIVVHRLDMDTSGLLVVGLTPEAQRVLSGQFEARSVGKRYEALLMGRLSNEVMSQSDDAGWWTIDFPIRPDLENRPWQIHDPVHGRRAVTRVCVMELGSDRTRVELEPVTGRAHQLRVHCAFAPPLGLGHPVLGDVLYGPEPTKPAGGAARLMLHAKWLAFDDPETGERVEVGSEAGF